MIIFLNNIPALSNQDKLSSIFSW